MQKNPITRFTQVCLNEAYNVGRRISTGGRFASDDARYRFVCRGIIGRVLGKITVAGRLYRRHLRRAFSFSAAEEAPYLAENTRAMTKMMIEMGIRRPEMSTAISLR